MICVFQKAGVELILRQVLIPLWNAYSFFTTYARIYDWTPKPQDIKPAAVIDHWILSLLNKLIKEVEFGMDDYDLSHAVEPFIVFVDQLTNWYTRCEITRNSWAITNQPSCSSKPSTKKARQIKN